jgi:Na+-transporting methylmalonyl-CoA/oxaloacetate decarboxylase gamma subunit
LNTNNFIEGANLLTTGMVTVFIFLGVLILAINLIKLLFSERIETISPSSIQNNNEISNDHKKIIKAIGLRINE